MDFKPFATRLGLELDEFVEIVELFAKTAVSYIETLEDALKAGNISEAAETAHTLKGSAGNLGFKDVAETAQAIESKLKNNDLSQSDEIIVELKERLNPIKAGLEAL